MPKEFKFVKKFNKKIIINKYLMICINALIKMIKVVYQ